MTIVTSCEHGFAAAGSLIIVFKVISSVDWDEAMRLGHLNGSADDLRDGFIHLSDASQLNGTLEKYFKRQRDLVLIAFDADTLGPALRWEQARGGELFPHFYGPLPVSLALWARSLPLDERGIASVDPAWLGC